MEDMVEDRVDMVKAIVDGVVDMVGGGEVVMVEAMVDGVVVGEVVMVEDGVGDGVFEYNSP